MLFLDALSTSASCSNLCVVVDASAARLMQFGESERVEQEARRKPLEWNVYVCIQD